ncbi:MAG: hypothetical protein WCK03_01405 [Candidatus Taylorbacteria bacterium]
MESDDKSYIEELKKSLYSRGSPDVRTRRKLRFTDKAPDVNTAWEKPVEDPVVAKLNEYYEDHSMSYLKKILIGSIIFCVVAIGIGAYLLLNGANMISPDNIDININGPVSIPGGTPVSFGVIVTNRNNIDLQTVDLSVDFPAGTTDAVDSTIELKTYQQLMGDLPAGSSSQKEVKAIIFGEENMQKTMTVKVTYKIKGSNNLFSKKKTYDVLINSSPVSLVIDSFKEVSSGQEFDMKINLKSNSQEILKNVLLKVQYPFGFTFITSDIKPQSNNSSWKIGDIPAGTERVITIHGKLTGENSDQKVFRFAAGAISSVDQTMIGTQYIATELDMSVQKPFISLGMSVDGNTANSDYIGQFGRDNAIEINWSNNLPVSVSNLIITVKLSGSAYDKSTVVPQDGYFKSGTDEIVWNQQTSPEFASVGAGANGTIAFRLVPKDFGSAVRSVVNPQILISASVSGDRTQETSVSSNLNSAVQRSIRVSSSVSLSGRVIRSTGPFVNTGPIPPVVEKASTFTIIWDVDNTSSAVGNAQVTAILPSAVKWLNAFDPTNENITYDPNTGRVTWLVGNVGTYTLNSLRRREVAFQVSVTPAINHVGQSMTLVNQSQLTAADSFTATQLTSTQEELTTRFGTDPIYRDGDGVVVK